jgi:hypothetical protein
MRYTKEMEAEPNSETEKKEKEMGVNLVDPIGLKMISSIKKYEAMSAEDKTVDDLTKEMGAKLNSETEIKDKENNRPVGDRPPNNFYYKRNC